MIFTFNINININIKKVSEDIINFKFYRILYISFKRLVRIYF